MARLRPTEKTLKKLFALTGNRCAFPDCEHAIVNEHGDLIAEVCHIEAAEPGGERFNPDQTDEERRHFGNLIVLCPTHHTTTNNVDEYPVERLQEMKRAHEERNRSQPLELTDDQWTRLIGRVTGIAVSKLPAGATRTKLIGRSTELRRLTQALNGDKTHVLSLVAWGGTGKSALTVHWMVRLAKKNWPDIERYFDWSFYSQGTKGEQGTSADLFIAEALKHFGDPDPQAGSPHDRGDRLARLVAEQPTLLILDGLEPMQFGPGPQEGLVKDPALKSLLKGIAQRPFRGLLLITTREAVKDLVPFLDQTAVELQLENLTEAAGAELLHHLGVRRAGAKSPISPDDGELHDAVKEVNGHALTLQLMATYLARTQGGDIRRRDRFGFEQASKTTSDEHAFRVIAAYERWLSGQGILVGCDQQADPPDRCAGAETPAQADGSANLNVQPAPAHQSETAPLVTPYEGHTEGDRMLAVLRMLGLFDRPAPPGCLQALRREPVIKGLNDAVAGASDDEWHSALTHLQDLGLIELVGIETSPTGLPSDVPVDAHPLIREYFARQLRRPDHAERRSGSDAVDNSPSTSNDGVAGVECSEPPDSDTLEARDARPQPPTTGTELSEGDAGAAQSLIRPTDSSTAWTEGHRRVFEYLCDSTPHHPDGIDGLAPLYQAIPHGCHAGLHNQVHADVYVDRILRGEGIDGCYSTYQLGAIGADLGAVACFFEKPWSQLSQNVTSTVEASLLNDAGFSLRALGRLTEAIEPMLAALQMRIEQKDWANAAIDAGNLSGLELTLGAVSAAIRDSEPIIDYTERSKKWGIHWSYWAQHADARHQAGERDESGKLFADLETRQAREWPHYPQLNSAQGFFYCDLLLSCAELGSWKVFLARTGCRPLEVNGRGYNNHSKVCDQVEERATHALQISQKKHRLLDIGLNNLTLARAVMYRTLTDSPGQQHSHAKFPKAASQHLNAAIEGLRDSGQADELPRGLLTRAWWRQVLGDVAGAIEDLDEAWEIAERGSMKLHQTDVLLTRGRLGIVPNGLQNEDGEYPWGSPRQDLDRAAELIQTCGYHRRDEELADALVALNFVESRSDVRT